MLKMLKPSQMLAAAASAIALWVGIVQGLPILFGAIPFVERRTFDLYEIGNLNFQIINLKVQVTALQMQLSQNSDTFALIARINNEIDNDQTEMTSLQCEVRGDTVCAP